MVQVSPRSRGDEERGRLGAGVEHARLARAGPGVMFQTLIIFSGVSLRFSPLSRRNISSTVLMGRPDFEGPGEDGDLFGLRPGLAEVVGVVRGRAVDKVSGGGVQALIARVESACA